MKQVQKSLLLIAFGSVLTVFVVQLFNQNRALRFSNRDKRSAELPDNDNEFVEEFSISDIIDGAAFLSIASFLDQAGCAARLVCEVHQLTDEELDMTSERLIDLFSEKSVPPTVERLQMDPKATFEYAAFIGKHSPNDTEVCAQVFNRCPVAAQDILDSLKE